MSILTGFPAPQCSQMSHEIFTGRPHSRHEDDSLTRRNRYFLNRPKPLPRAVFNLAADTRIVSRCLEPWGICNSTPVHDLARARPAPRKDIETCALGAQKLRHNTPRACENDNAWPRIRSECPDGPRKGLLINPAIESIRYSRRNAKLQEATPGGTSARSRHAVEALQPRDTRPRPTDALCGWYSSDVASGRKDPTTDW